MAKIEKGKEKDEKVSFYFNWKLFLWLEHKLLVDPSAQASREAHKFFN